MLDDAPRLICPAGPKPSRAVLQESHIESMIVNRSTTRDRDPAVAHTLTAAFELEAPVSLHGLATSRRSLKQARLDS